MNNELFVVEPVKNQQDGQTAIGSIANKLKTGQYQKPVFQRDYIWTRRQLIEWANSIIANQAIGVIVTYQLVGGGTTWIADGFQRLTSTSYFMKAPQEYGFNFGPNQAIAYCDAFQITVQHRVYQDHKEAMEAFQRLNQGTALTPAEFYKGQLCVNSHIGRRIYAEIPQIVSDCARRIAKKRTLSRDAASGRLRDSLATFYQYISKFKGTRFWNATRTTLEETNPIERRMGDYVSNWDDIILDSAMRDFKAFLDSQIAVIEHCRKKTGQQKKLFSPAVLSWLLHLSIWRKNNKRPVALHKRFLIAFLELSKEYGTFSSRFDVPNYRGERYSVTLASDELLRFNVLCEVTGIDLLNGNTRISNEQAPPGYDVSHISPVSEVGNGETILEPSSLNRARGAKAMTQQEIDFLKE